MEEKRKRRSPEISDMIGIGKLQPQAVDFEEAVIGAIMIEREAFSEVANILNSNSFYKEAHSLIFKACETLFNTSQRIDILTVTNHLRKTGELDIAGGPIAITQLTNRVASAANIIQHSMVIQEKYLLRKLISVATELQRKAFEDSGDPLVLIDELETELQKFSQYLDKGSEIQPFTEDLKEVFRAAEQAAQNRGITGIPSKFNLVNAKTNGFQPGELTIIAGRPGMGKTAYALQEACFMSLLTIGVKAGAKVAFFSLEMSKKQLTQRIISSEFQIELTKIKKGNFTEEGWRKINDAVNRLWGAALHLDDTAGISVHELRRKCKRMHNKHGLTAIFLDYLQLMEGGNPNNKNGNREQEVSYISRSLKKLAKELNVPVIALAQISRASEKRGGDFKPILSDLRESGSIEQDADAVVFIHRPEYYGFEEEADGSSTAGLAYLIYGKLRDGDPGKINLKFDGPFTRFTNFEYDYTKDLSNNEIGQTPPF